MPGLINTHLHSGLLRGTAEQLPVGEWLRVHIDPMRRVLRPAEAEAASWLCYADLAELIGRARALVPGLFERRAAHLAEHGESPAVLGGPGVSG